VREATPWSYDLNGAATSAISAAKAGVRPVALKPRVAGAGPTLTATAK
jgi:hypothetical protein